MPDSDPFHLPMNPRAALADAFAHRGGVLPGRTDVPRGVHDWVVCLDGDCLTWQRQEKSNDAVVTLRFLVDTYLGPGAAAATSGSADFADFTFDHRLDGLIAAARDDTDELFLIRVVDSVVTTETLVPGRCSW